MNERRSLFADPYEIHAGIPDLREAILRHVRSSMARTWKHAMPREKLFAVSYAVRDRLLDIAVETFRRYARDGAKEAYYLSMEFLMGRALGNNLMNLGLTKEARDVLAELGTDLDELLDEERDAALGNGGLGRLAACFLDSLATLGMPGHGYGINYEFGLFRQVIRDGRQVELPDAWRENGTPWTVERADEPCTVRLFGHVEPGRFENGEYRPHWREGSTIVGIPWDMLVAGYGGKTVNALRLFTGRASREFDMGIFNEGDYVRAVSQKVESETVSKVLYPSERAVWGPKLRLIQEYFLVACALEDIIRRADGDDLTTLPDRVAIQLNDTHPALAVAELIRILVDEKRVPWGKAFEITQKTLAYTNHTLLPEALERWPVPLMAEVLPRHLDIIFEINGRFLKQIGEIWPNDPGRVARMSIIEEGQPQQVRMANLAIVGSRSVNGVAAVHSDLVKTRLVPDFHALWPERFNNKTNGVTPRRWILLANPGLAHLLDEAVDGEWVTDLEKLRAIEPLATDAGFGEAFRGVKRDNKERLAALIAEECGVAVDPDSIFDAQAKRIHEYKRQLLMVLHIVHRYLEVVDAGRTDLPPRTFVFSGKAAPGYRRAKEIIELIHVLADLVNENPKVNGCMRVAFVPNYGVSVAEVLIPAADLSEQISTAGFEASGTGNMKFAMNGALTIGTLDGANIEMAEEVGEENLIIFGKTVEEIAELTRSGTMPRAFYDGSPWIRRILDFFRTDRLSPGRPGVYGWVFSSLVESFDRYFHLADLEAYLEAQERADALYADPAAFTEKAVLNVARMGKFSSDRTVAQYASEIWGIEAAR